MPLQLCKAQLVLHGTELAHSRHSVHLGWVNVHTLPECVIKGVGNPASRNDELVVSVELCHCSQRLWREETHSVVASVLGTEQETWADEGMSPGQPGNGAAHG